MTSRIIQTRPISPLLRTLDRRRTLAALLLTGALAGLGAQAQTAASPTSVNTAAPSGSVSPLLVADSSGRLILVSAALIRYTYDPLTRQLTIPRFVIGNAESMPAHQVWKQVGPDLVLTLPAGTTYTLNADGKQLTLEYPTRAVPSTETSLPLLYRLANADPMTVVALLQRMYPDVRMDVDMRQRALIITASAEQRGPLLQALAELDAERPQVMFEAEILEVNTNLSQSLGLEYDSVFTFKIGESIPAGLLQLGELARSALNLTVKLNALKTSGAARVLAQPRVTTLDGMEARINSTQTTPIILPGGSNGATTVQNVTTGITLRMTPKVAPDGTVEANLSITVSIPTGTTSQGVPQFSTREATTTVRVRNGEPIAIGGLLESRRIEGTQKVPFLGDIPLLGQLFTTTRTDIHNTDLIIVVTPRLIMNLVQPPAAPSARPATP